MGNDKAYNKPVYNELIRVSNLYYSNCSLSDLLDYLAGISGFTFVLTDTGFHPVAARLVFGSLRRIRSCFWRDSPRRDLTVFSRLRIGIRYRRILHQRRDCSL